MVNFLQLGGPIIMDRSAYCAKIEDILLNKYFFGPILSSFPLKTTIIMMLSSCLLSHSTAITVLLLLHRKIFIKAFTVLIHN